MLNFHKFIVIVNYTTYMHLFQLLGKLQLADMLYPFLKMTIGKTIQ